MRSTMRLIPLASTLLAVTACASSPVIVADPSACADLVPADWAKGVPGAAPPASLPPVPAAATAAEQLAQAMIGLKSWTAFGVDQSNRLDQANGRTADAIGIIARCEARDAAAVRKARPKFLGMF